MRKVVERVEHNSVFHLFNETREAIRNPIAKEMRRKFFLGLYGANTQFCTECGRPLEFVIVNSDRFVEAVFICRPCGGKEESQTIKYGQGI